MFWSLCAITEEIRSLSNNFLMKIPWVGTMMIERKRGILNGLNAIKKYLLISLSCLFLWNFHDKSKILISQGTFVHRIGEGSLEFSFLQKFFSSSKNVEERIRLWFDAKRKKKVTNLKRFIWIDRRNIKFVDQINNFSRFSFLSLAISIIRF